jgi:hypothetical protein
MIYVYLAIAFYVGLFLGLILQRWLARSRNFSGVIKVTRYPDKTLFSLELDEDPEMIAYLDAVIFRVETSEEDEDRG